MSRTSVEQTLQAAVQHHQAGRLQQAEALYRQVLNQQPNQADALHLLGLIAHQSGQNEVAIELISRAIRVRPNDAAFYLNLGVALRESGRRDEAIAAYRQSITLDPRSPEAHNNLGLILRDTGQRQEAIAAFERAIALRPAYAEAHSNLGNALLDTDPSRAVASCRRAVQLNPGSAHLHVNLAVVLQKLGQLDEAMATCQRAIQIRADQPEAHFSLGAILLSKRRPAEAEACFRRAIGLRESHVEAHANLGAALHAQGKLDAALAACQRAVAIKPDFAFGYYNLGVVLQAMDRLTDAGDAFATAIELNPQYAEAHSNLASVYQHQGKLTEAIASFRTALAIKPDLLTAADSLLFTLQYPDDIDPAEIYAEHRKFDRQFGQPLASRVQPHSNDRSTDRILRIGYVSPDFRNHAVAYFVEPILAGHDRSRFEIFCYSAAPVVDAVTQRLQSLGHTWRDISSMSDDQAAEVIRRDRIDILVDLAVHTHGNRLLVFARKPAPIQMTYVGYAATTGLSAIDYRITDAIVDPSGASEAFHSEKLLRLPRTFWCYRPPAAAPPVSTLPALTAGHITFGSANILAKITPTVLDMWSEILRSFPGAQLILKARGFADPGTRELALDRFRSRGIGPERLTFERWGNLQDYLQFFARVDIVLDTYPFNGGTTTCHSLWMGTPVISLSGATSVSRVGSSILSNVGMPELIARNPHDYIRIATELARDPKQLEQLRETLRQRMSASPLMNEPRFAHDLESAYRAAFTEWVGSPHD